MKRVISIITVFVLIFLSGCVEGIPVLHISSEESSQTDIVYSLNERYTSEFMGISFDYDEKWVIGDENPIYPELSMVIDPEIDNKVIFSLIDREIRFSDIDEEELKGFVSFNNPLIELVDCRKTKIKNFDVFVFAGFVVDTVNIGPVLDKQSVWYLIELPNKQLLSMVCTAKKDGFKNRKYYEQIIESLEFLNDSPLNDNAYSPDEIIYKYF